MKTALILYVILLALKTAGLLLVPWWVLLLPLWMAVVVTIILGVLFLIILSTTPSP